jgi:hypothetical protein
MPRASTISRRIAALGPDDLEQVLGDLARDRSLSRSGRRYAAKLLKPTPGFRDDSRGFLVQSAEQFVDDPVGGLLAVAPRSVATDS